MKDPKSLIIKGLVRFAFMVAGSVILGCAVGWPIGVAVFLLVWAVVPEIQ